jgi:hypothetical protein
MTSSAGVQVTVEDAGNYMCQINTDPMTFQVKCRNFFSRDGRTDGRTDNTFLR